MVFSASGLVPVMDLIFPVFTSLYLLGLARTAFPSHGPTATSPEIFHGSRLFRLYVVDVAWFWFGRSLAMANFGYFSINLLGFLIPRLLPRAFERYFRERDEVIAKSAEDHRRASPSASPTKANKTDLKPPISATDDNKKAD
ncbi:hypothetical protein Sjap_016547 [Stephania japonica]|uniref:DUF7733 domain-containing protein n=1 Tax=Stephania japonica TaxID=461633 RepID=A0AAP0IM43_9MAGN